MIPAKLRKPNLRKLGVRVAIAAALSLSFGAARAEDSKVTIDNFTFTPVELKLKVGDTVTWTNHDDIPHNIVSDEKSFKSKVLKTDETFVYTFSKPGTYTYLCGLHPQMTGKIVVQ